MDAAGKLHGFEPNMGNDKVVVKREATADYDEENGNLEEDKKKKGVACVGVGGSGKKGSSGGGGSGMRCCQADKCNADLHNAKQYHRRHKVCEYHAKAQVVIVGGMRSGFVSNAADSTSWLNLMTQKEVAAGVWLNTMNGEKRTESRAEGSSHKGTGPQLKDIVCGQVDERRRIQVTIQENAAYKHFQIR